MTLFRRNNDVVIALCVRWDRTTLPLRPRLHYIKHTVHWLYCSGCWFHLGSAYLHINGTNNCWFPLARKWPTWKWTWIWIPYGKIAKKCPRYFRRDSRGNPRDLNMCRTGRSAALSRGRKSMPPIRVPMRMSRDYLYDFTLIFRWSTFSSTVNLCNINCVICSDTHSSFGPPIVAQSMSCEGVHDHENGVSKLT